MAKRLAVLARHLTAGASDGSAPPAAYDGFPQATTATQCFPDPAHDILFSEDLLTTEECAVRDVARSFAVSTREKERRCAVRCRLQQVVLIRERFYPMAGSL